uniref:glycosyltransferase family 4 protein n=1 Tax=Polaribacter sp. TaxID=1920175 RepID=UPI0040482246
MFILPYITNPIFIFFVGFFTTYLIIPKIIWVVSSRNLIDHPDKRSSHKVSTPTMAGVAFFLSIIVALFFIKTTDLDGIGINLILALAVIFIIGLKDDLVVSSPRAKIGGQLIAICAVLFSSSFQEIHFDGFFGLTILPIGLSIFLVGFLMLAIINSFNLIDGIDGLASIIGIVIFSAFSILFSIIKLDYYFLISLVLVGTLTAYLRYNFSRSQKIFMGDTGSLIIGFCIAFLSIKFLTADILSRSGFPFLEENKVIVFMSILFIPFFDTIRIIGVRLINKKSPFEPDRSHIHHILIDSGLRHYKVSLFLAVLNVLIILFVIGLSNYFNSSEMLIVFFLIFVFMLYLFHVLKNNVKSKNKAKGIIKFVNFIF